jgi:AcrR family transcriptional regulator
MVHLLRECHPLSVAETSSADTMHMIPAKPPAAQQHPPRPRGRPKAEDVEELERRLISVARQIFIERGYGAASMASIAQVARVSKNTLYARFPSKADLFRAIIDRQIERTDARVQKHAPRSDSTLESALRAYGEQTMQASLEPETLNINRMIYGEGGRFPELGEIARARHKIGVGRVVEMIRTAGGMENADPGEVERAAETFVINLRGWYDTIMVTNHKVGAGEIRNAVDRIVRLFLAGREGW